MPISKDVQGLLARIKGLRRRADIAPQEMDRRLLIGPGWTARFESGEIAPSIDLVLAMLSVLRVPPGPFLGSHPWSEIAQPAREMYAEPQGDDLIIHFHYADHDARYRLRDAGIEEFQAVLQELQRGLARLVHRRDDVGNAIQTDSVARTFLRAVRTWPHANPSDLWWFLVYRGYCDPFNHPASNARRDFGQSWKRTAGWALEEVLVRHYGPYLKSRGVNLFIASGPRKLNLLRQLRVEGRVEADKVDVLLTGAIARKELCFGVVHVKASFAERRTDDQPLSQALIRAGYASPLWTMDCKSTPSAEPLNRGELGAASDANARSAKRKDIEDDGYFSACFSYNANTIPTPPNQPAKARIFVCDFRDPNDSFSGYIVSEWGRAAQGAGRPAAVPPPALHSKPRRA